MAGEPAVDDLELLRRHEPILRFTAGENFLPMDVGTYVAHASLDVRLADGSVEELVPAGELTLERLAAPIPGAPPGRQFLRVARERTASELAPVLLSEGIRPPKSGFRRGPGRLTRVGYLSRLVDALFSITLLLRGRVPGALAADSIRRYRAMGEATDRHPYYGRVVREAGWTALQYWFFYAFNDWRSGYHGANDHEADWEMIMVLCDTAADEQPVWAMYAQHDYNGADLRRRWDHAEQLEVIDGHPVVNCGAGSHASYYVAGEYMTEHELALPTPVRAIISAVSRLIGTGTQSRREKAVPIAFIDYARGDGASIGPGQEREWTAVLVDREGWASGYAGLWGAHVKDPFEGEDAPAGPMHARDGSPRDAWLDPLGFAELDTVPPPSVEPEILAAQADAITARRPELDAEITRLSERAAAGGAKERALQLGGTPADRGPRAQALADAREQLAALRTERAADDALLIAINARVEHLRRGETDAPDAHLRHVAQPTPPSERRFGGVLEVWAAVSIGLLLIGLVYVMFVLPHLEVLAALAVIGVFLFVDALLRGRLANGISAVALTLALATAVILVVTFWSQVLIGVALLAGVFVIWQNLSELF